MNKKVIYVIDFDNLVQRDKGLKELEVGLNDGVIIERCDSVGISLGGNSSYGVANGKLVYVLNVPEKVEFPLKG